MSAAASVALHLRRSGYRIRLVTGGASAAGSAASGVDLDTTEHDGEGALLDTLAEVNPSAAANIPQLVEVVRHRSDGGLVIAVLGGLTLAEAEALGALRATGTTCIALLIDAGTWLNQAEPARAESTAAHEAAALTLLRSGWRVIGVEHGASLTALWPQTARGSQGFALRAALAETVAPTGVRA